MTPKAEPKGKAEPKVYAAIAAVQTVLAVEGIAKERQNTQGGGFKFRGIDDVYNALASILGSHGLCIIPRVLKREQTERTTQKGGTLFCVVVDVEYDLVSAVDGSKHTARVQGEAFDSGDKATSKALSAAYKYLCFQLFCIPTEGDNDADATTHQVAAPPVDQPLTPDESDRLEALVAESVAAGGKTTIDGLAAWLRLPSPAHLRQSHFLRIETLLTDKIAHAKESAS